MKQKDTAAVDKGLDNYIEQCGTIKPDILAILFNSLSSSADEKYLTKWIDLINKFNIDIPENAYVCRNGGVFFHV